MSGRCALELLQQSYACSEAESVSDTDLPNACQDLQSQPVVLAHSGRSGSKRSGPSKRVAEKRKRKEERASKRKPILQNCGCKLKCYNKIARERRSEINSCFWKLSETEQKSFIWRYSKRNPIKRRRGQMIGDNRRQFSYKYQLEDERGVLQDVCCAFFLNTLGYDMRSSNIIYRYHDQAHNDNEPEEKRGKYIRSKSLQDIVKQDIMLYSPTISHYRREHAPHALYLPSDLSVQKMFDSFNERQLQTEEQSCSYSFYCKMINELNIKFTQLGHEECELCQSQKTHEKETGHAAKVDSNELEDEQTSTCETCTRWKAHMTRAIAGREQYDSDRMNVAIRGSAFSVDLEKVVQLPRMESFKEVIFCKRIIALNETFAPLGGAQNGPVRAFLWNDTIAGRKASHIASVFYKFFATLDSKNVILWLDNCAGQNKNWNLMVLLSLLINSAAIELHQITLKYLEPGHTFMSADAFHASVERTMKRAPRGEVHNFQDFVECVQSSGSTVEPRVHEMQPSDFFECSVQFKQSVLKNLKDKPKMASIKQVIFTKGNFEMSYSYDYDGNMKKLKLFTKKQLKEIAKPSFNILNKLQRQTEPNGIQKSRKDFIIRKVLPLMPDEKRDYWINLPENEEAALEDF